MRVTAPRLVFALLAALLPSAPALADSRHLRGGPGQDGEECPDNGETAEYHQARYQWYVATYGERGVFNPERRLDDLRNQYAEYRRGLKERAARRVAAAPFESGTFRLAGPVNGAGRMTAIEPHPFDPNVVWAGAAGGGCWKSLDGGATWRVLTDGLADLSVGAVAVAPSNPNVVYLGTGEGGYALGFIPGIGVFRSTDGGDTWILPDTVVAPLVYRLSVDPRNADWVLAFTNNGVQRSTDGARTWTQTSPGFWGDATDVARDAGNPDILHATFWVRGMDDQGRYAKSTDGGASWIEKTSGLPPNPKARMSVALSSDGGTVYALAAGPFSAQPPYAQVGLYRSTDAGESWTRRFAETPNVLGAQGWYDNALAVDPDSADVLLLGGQSGGGTGHYRSADGGASATVVGVQDAVHVDVHHLVFRKYGPLKVAWTANDGGLWRSTDGGVRWQDRNAGLVTRQYYSVAMDPTRPNVLYAGAQDNGTNRVSADTGLQERVASGDGFETAVNPDSPATVFGNVQFSGLFRSTRDGAPGSFHYIGQVFAGALFSSTGGDGIKPFLSWVTLDPNDPRTVYTGTYRPWRSEDSGETWAPLGTIAFLNGGTTSALAVARGRPERLLAAQAGRILLSNDRGVTFAQLTNGLPVTVTFRNVEIDPNNPDVLFVCSASSSGAVPGRVFRSTDGGATFARSDAGLPSFGVETVRVDPGDSSTVYAGTLVGLYRSRNGGVTWDRWGDGLPAAAIHEVRVAPDGSRIVVATHGRGLWIADGLAANRSPAVSISSPPADIAIDPGQSVTFEGSASDPDGDPVVLRWDFGDGRTGTGGSPGSIRYATPGHYVASLVGVDVRGGRGGARVTVSVRSPNDDCANAAPLALLPFTRVTVRTGNGGAAVWDVSDPPTCAGSGNFTRNSIWYTLTPPADGTLELDTVGSIGDTVMALFPGSCASPGTALDCNDDIPGTSAGPSRLEPLPVTAGTPYRLLVGSWSDDAGTLGGPADVLRVRALFTPSAGFQYPGTSSLLPVVLDTYGVNGAHFLSDLVLLNRSAEPLTIGLTYGGSSAADGDTVSMTLPKGTQLRADDALAALRLAGIPIRAVSPSSGPVGSLTALVTGGDPASLLLASRTASPNPNAAVGGSFGFSATGTAFADTAEGEDVFLFGLRQTARDRSNLALVHVRTPLEGAPARAPITLRVDVFDASGNPAPESRTVTLSPGGWTQINEVLLAAGLPAGSADGGWARVRKTAGSGRFLAYAVINDQLTADGSFVPMTRGSRFSSGETLLLPVAIETPGQNGSFFTTELILANASATPGQVQADLLYFSSPLLAGGGGSGTVTVPVPSGGQRVIPNLIGFLRESGLAIPAGGGGAVFVTFRGLDPADPDFAGARISTPNPDTSQGGSFGLFLPAVRPQGLMTDSATVMGLHQDSSARSNLAAVNAGPDAVTLSVSLRSAADGSAIGSTLTRTLAAGEWYQWSNVFGQAGLGGGDGYAVVTRTSGSSAWYAYGVLNDAATSDGSAIAAAK